jgi:general secretion pathway protein A
MSPADSELVSVGGLAERLVRIEPHSSARSALAAVLAAWNERPLAEGEVKLPDAFETVAWRRGLQALQLTANRSMLQLLDLPALLVVRPPGAAEPRWLALIGLDESRATLVVDGGPVTIGRETLEVFWGGQAHVLWRDFDGLGPGLQPGARGLAVAQLQTLLRRAGIADLEPNGTFDAGTARAVVDFQRRHRLDADGVVGPLTRIVLYGAAADRRRPGLAIALEQSS